jgi:hypothetical protein
MKQKNAEKGDQKKEYDKVWNLIDEMQMGDNTFHVATAASCQLI